MANRYWVGGTNTWNATVGTKWAAASGGAGGQTVPTAADDVFFDGIATGGGSAGVITVTVGAASTCKSIDFTGFVATSTFAGASALAISGGLTWNAGMNRTFTGAVTFNLAAGTAIITSNTITFGGAITMNDGGGGATYQLADTFVSTSTVTLTQGTFDTNQKSTKCTKFVSSGALVRALNMTNTTFELTGTATPWDITTATNMTLTSTGSLVLFTNSSATNPTMHTGGLTYNDIQFAGTGTGTYTVSESPTCRDWIISNAAGANFQCATSPNIRNVDFTGFTGAWVNTGVWSLTGNLTLGGGMSITGTTQLFWVATSGTQTITSNGVPMNNIIRLDGPGSTLTLADTFSTTNALQIKKGTFDTSNKTCTFSGIAASQAGFGVRAINLGSSVVTLTGTSPFSNSGDNTNLTLNAGTSSIVVSTTGVGTFGGGGLTFYDLTCTGAGGSLTLSPGTGAYTFHKITINVGPYTFLFPNATTTTLGQAGLSATGTAGNLVALRSSTVGGNATISVPSNDVVCDFVDVRDVIATGGARFFAGRRSTNSGNNNGWRFTDLYRSPVQNSIGFVA